MQSRSNALLLTLAVAIPPLSLTGGLVAAHVIEPAQRIPIGRQPKPPVTDRGSNPGDSCTGGGSRAARIELVPDAVVVEKGNRRIEYHAEVEIDRAQNVGVAWEADVVDDRGRVVRSKLDAGSARKRKGEVAMTKALLTTLPDGYYALRVRAAVAPPNEPVDVIETVRHLEVSNGRWSELTDLEWFARSRATEVLSEAEVAARGL